jgi:WD40 repeat protein
MKVMMEGEGTASGRRLGALMFAAMGAIRVTLGACLLLLLAARSAAASAPAPEAATVRSGPGPMVVTIEIPAAAFRLVPADASGLRSGIPAEHYVIDGASGGWTADRPLDAITMPVTAWVDADLEVESVAEIQRATAGTGVHLDRTKLAPPHAPVWSPPVVVGESWLRGRKLVLIRAFPLSADPASGEVRLATQITIALHGRKGAPPAVAGPRETPWESKVDQVLGAGPACDLRQAPTPPAGPLVPPSAAGPSPTFRPTRDGSPVEYVIITNGAMAPAFQELADWKSQKGVKAVVRTLEWVAATYPPGVDRAEQLRFFLADAYANWGTLWVLLGGDSDVVPVRYATHALGLPPELVPTDLYYGALDGNWNHDGDASFGEGRPPGQPVGGDLADLVPELMVGRATVSTPEQAQTFVDKVIRYEQGLITGGGGYPGSVLLLGERLSPALDGAQFCEQVRARLPGGLRVVRMYENYTAYPGALPEVRQRVLDSLDVGFGLVHHVGHGFRNTMSVGQGALDNADIDALTNGNRGSVLYAVNCSSTAFDFNAISERFLKNPGGGGVAYIGSTRLGFTGDSGDFQNAFYDLVFGEDVVAIGQALALSKIPFLAESVSETPARWLTFSILLLGDPEMPIWRRVPPPLTVSHSGTMALGSGPFAVQVSAGGSPLAGARVSLRKAGDAMALAPSGSSGTAQVDFRPSTLGTFTVTVTHPDYRPRVASASVVASNAPAVELVGTVLDDDASAPSRGNGDGKADAGEAVALRLSLQNRGGTTATGVRAVLRVRGQTELATVTQQLVTYGNLAPQSQSAGNGSYVIDLHPGAPPAFQPVLELAIESGARRWLETFVLPVHVIRIAHDGHSVVDSPPGGNGNGIPEPNERVEIQLHARNDGTGPADGVLAILRVLHWATQGPHPNVTVLDGEARFDRVPVGGVKTGDPFVIRLGPTAAASSLLLELAWSDLHAQRGSERFDLVPPPPVTGVQGAGLETSITLQWSPPAAADVGGYDIYRGALPAGPFVRVNASRIRGSASYEDRALAPLTRYYYRVVTRDSSGNASPPSATAAVTTSPGMATGWPVEIGQETSAAVLVEDLDQDGDYELMTGANAVYAWHDEASEVRDGDGNPQTSGVFTLDGANAETGYRATPAAADLSGDGDLELVAVAWEEAKVYVWNANGSREPGWPKTLGGGYHWASPVIEDLDRDGSLDIVVASGHPGKIYAWHRDGREIADGDQNPTTNGVLYATGTYFLYSSPAVGDLDGDLYPEIVVGTQSADGKVVAVKRTGQMLAGWPRPTGGQVTASPALADLDGDGRYEVIVASECDSVFIWRGNGTRYPGWPQPAVVNSTYGHTSSPVIADLDGNGQLDILFAANDGRVHAWNRQGQRLAGWTAVTFASGYGEDYTQATPTVADVDGDGQLEVLLGAEDRKIYGWNHNGTELAGFPLTTGGEIRGAVSLFDVDGDGRMEAVVVGNDRQVAMWDLPGELRADRMPWPFFRHDSRNTGRYGADIVATGVAGPELALDPGGAPPALAFLGAAPNPFAAATRLRFSVGLGGEAGSEAAAIRVRIFDVAGRVVATLVDRPLDPGLHEVLWDGQGMRGAAVPSGVYFVRLEQEGAERQGRILRLR